VIARLRQVLDAVLNETDIPRDTRGLIKPRARTSDAGRRAAQVVGRRLKVSPLGRAITGADRAPTGDVNGWLGSMCSSGARCAPLLFIMGELGAEDALLVGQDPQALVADVVDHPLSHQELRQLRQAPGGNGRS
jgi:hypothetical protein